MSVIGVAQRQYHVMGDFQATHADNTSSSRLFCILSFHGNKKAHVSSLNLKTSSMTQMKTIRSPFVHCRPSASNNHTMTRHGMHKLPSAPSQWETMGISQGMRQTWRLMAQCLCGPAVLAGSHSGSPQVHSPFPRKRSAGPSCCLRMGMQRYSYITRRG